MHDSRVQTVTYEISHVTHYFYSEEVPLCHNEVHLAPRDTARQTCLFHELALVPPAAKIEEALDYFGNRVSYFTIQEQHSELLVTSKSRVKLLPRRDEPPGSPAWEEVRERMRRCAGEDVEICQFIYDSPQVAVSRELAEYAAPSFPGGRPWHEAVLDLTARIFRDFVYDPTATNTSTPLAEVLESRRGVCQDFAHLEIGCLRAMGLPARYVSGYLQTTPPPGKPRLVGADASHAWISAWCPEMNWGDFDPTNNVVPNLDHVTLAWGRDYSDVCPIKGVFVGGGQHSMRVSVDVVRKE
jgi:transglutaminase-like putative cysteine protease